MMPAVNDGQKCSSFFSILISLPARRRTYTAEKYLLHGHKMGTG